MTGTDVQIEVFAYDPFVARSDRNGALIRYQIYSAQPIKTIEIDLLNDGEPAQQTDYKVQQGADGRYYAGLAIRPTRNGTWPIQIKAWDARNSVGVTVCTPGITVTQ